MNRANAKKKTAKTKKHAHILTQHFHQTDKVKEANPIFIAIWTVLFHRWHSPNTHKVHKCDCTLLLKFNAKRPKRHMQRRKKEMTNRKKTEHTMQKFIININAINALCRVAMRVTESMKCTHTIERQKKNTHTVASQSVWNWDAALIDPFRTVAPN